MKVRRQTIAKISHSQQRHGNGVQEIDEFVN